MSIVVTKNPIKEQLTPSPNGVSTQFYTSNLYTPGSVSVWINGVKLISGWDDGFEELGTNVLDLKEAPLLGDSIQAEYEPL